MMRKIKKVNSNIYYLDLREELEDISQRELVQKDGTYRLFVKSECFYILKNNQKFKISPSAYVIIEGKEIEVEDIEIY
ncbi:MAG: hypothetical protein N3D10_03320 [Candidatus Micrarchaeota archaeon]|nr:hypothetical protein [Candidatus Micrarchaeota archaeon]